MVRLPGPVLVLLVLAAASAAAAQPAEKVPRVGFLWTASPASVGPYRDGFLRALAELGHGDGRDIRVEHRYGEEDVNRLPRLAAEIVSQGVDVIMTQGTPAARAAKHATTTIPIVMVNVGDPVGTGLVASLSRPGGNLTGLTIVAPELSAKRLELLKEAIPKMARVAVLWESASTWVEPSKPAEQQRQPAALAAPARALGLRLQILEVRGPKEFDDAFAAARRSRADGLLVLPSPLLNYHRASLVDLAARHRMPATYQAREFVDAGGLMSYGPELADGFRRAATYVDKVLKGARPADLPIEQPTKFELAINLKTAVALGLTIPPSVLARADHVIR
jgi:putative tryptophan/tyrosine transport system substrate-binding protein